MVVSHKALQWLFHSRDVSILVDTVDILTPIREDLPSIFPTTLQLKLHHKYRNTKIQLYPVLMCHWCTTIRSTPIRTFVWDGSLGLASTPGSGHNSCRRWRSVSEIPVGLYCTAEKRQCKQFWVVAWAHLYQCTVYLSVPVYSVPGVNGFNAPVPHSTKYSTVKFSVRKDTSGSLAYLSLLVFISTISGFPCWPTTREIYF